MCIYRPLQPLLLFYVLLLPPPPRSTLFPYTTLFRSAVRPVRAKELRPRDVQQVRSALGDPRQGHRGAGGDRKSTRLNSSHVRISYAVFCLKKKKAKTTSGKEQTTIATEL